MRINGNLTETPTFSYGAYVDHSEDTPELRYGMRPKKIVLRRIGDIVEISTTNEHTRTISIDSPIELTDHQVVIKLDTTALINDGKINFDCSDLRLYQNETELPIWIHPDTIGTTETEIWTKVSLLTGNNTFTLRYGNLTSPSVSNGSAVFEIFDDFTGDLSDWTIHEGNWQIANGTLYCSIPNKVYQGISRPIAFTSFILETCGKTVQTGDMVGYHGLLPCARYEDTNNFVGFAIRPNNAYMYGFIRYVEGGGGWITTSDIQIMPFDTYHRVRLTKNGNTLTATDLTADVTDSCYYDLISDGNIALVNACGDVYYKYIFVRKYTPIEPTVTIGIEV